MKSLPVIFFALGLGLLTCVAQEAATSADVQEGPTIEELLKGDSFTNTAGVVMVKLSDTLWVGKYPVTQSEYKTVIGSNPSTFQGDNNPVETVSWHDARNFCAKLTDQEAQKKMLPTGFAYSIPTQAQWEFLMADASPEQAVTSIKAARKNTATVGSLSANRLGLHDIRGNVWCWCLDPQDKTYRVLRGGAWDTSLEINLRPEFRWFSNGPDDRRSSYGFRCVLQAK